MKIRGAYSFQVILKTVTDLKQLFGLKKQKGNVHITSKLNSTFGMIGKAKGIKMTAKAVGKNRNFAFV